MSLRHARMMLFLHGSFPLKTYAFLSIQTCQLIKAIMIFVPLLAAGAAVLEGNREIDEIDCLLLGPRGHLEVQDKIGQILVYLMFSNESIYYSTSLAVTTVVVQTERQEKNRKASRWTLPHNLKGRRIAEGVARVETDEVAQVRR